MVVVEAVILILIITIVYNKLQNRECTSKKRLDGKTVIVTGGTSGMGFHIATDLAKRGARTIITCPFTQEGETALKAIIKQTGNTEVVFKPLELSSFVSVQSFAADVIRNEGRLDILVNNAGVGVPDRGATEAGLDFIMHVNYLGHFQLTILLMPLLRKTKSSEARRVIFTSSILHFIGILRFNKIEKPTLLDRIRVYSDSKYCLSLMAHVLSKKLKASEVVVNSVDPGSVATRIFDSAGPIGVLVTVLYWVFFKSVHKGAQTALYAALDDRAGQVSGQFIRNCRVQRAKAAVYNEKLGEQLWDESVKLVKFTNKELDVFF